MKKMTEFAKTANAQAIKTKTLETSIIATTGHQMANFRPKTAQTVIQKSS
jgi:hypothetical protein